MYGDLDEDAVAAYRNAGDILTTVLTDAAAQVEPGTRLRDVATDAEDHIRELGGRPAFPVNISRDEEASHATPGVDDDSTFGEEMVCLDIGVHVDGYIADAAITIDHTGHSDLVEAAEEALAVAVDTAGPGVHTGEIGAEIEDVIDAYDYNPVLNLTGHGLAHWDAHTGPSIPNRGVDTGAELQPGDVIAIEPFATTGSGKVGEGSTAEIYSLDADRNVRDRRARQLLDTIRDEYRDLPFATRWLDGSRTEMSLQRLTQSGVLTDYPVLKEDDGELVSQAEHTLIITEEGCEVTTAGLYD